MAWASSGAIRRRTASSTAAGDPGSKKTSARPTTPASARDSIAAGPISWNDSIRNSSPKPGKRRSNSAPTASGVRSRGPMPVPPVTMTASASPASRATASRRAAGSSASSVSDATVNPASSIRRRKTRPPSFVSAVRLSDAVSSATRTDAADGDSDLWWATGAGEDMTTKRRGSEDQQTGDQADHAGAGEPERRGPPAARRHAAGAPGERESGDGGRQHQRHVADAAEDHPARCFGEEPELEHDRETDQPPEQKRARDEGRVAPLRSRDVTNRHADEHEISMARGAR